MTGVFCASRNCFRFSTVSVTAGCLQPGEDTGQLGSAWAHAGWAKPQAFTLFYILFSIDPCRFPPVALAALTSMPFLSHYLVYKSRTINAQCLKQGNITYVHGGIIMFQLHFLFQAFKQPNILLVLLCKLLPTQQILLLTLRSDAHVFFMTFWS